MQRSGAPQVHQYLEDTLLSQFSGCHGCGGGDGSGEDPGGYVRLTFDFEYAADGGLAEPIVKRSEGGDGGVIVEKVGESNPTIHAHVNALDPSGKPCVATFQYANPTKTILKFGTTSTIRVEFHMASFSHGPVEPAAVPADLVLQFDVFVHGHSDRGIMVLRRVGACYLFLSQVPSVGDANFALRVVDLGAKSEFKGNIYARFHSDYLRWVPPRAAAAASAPFFPKTVSLPGMYTMNTAEDFLAELRQHIMARLGLIDKLQLTIPFMTRVRVPTWQQALGFVDPLFYTLAGNYGARYCSEGFLSNAARRTCWFAGLSPERVVEIVDRQFDSGAASLSPEFVQIEFLLSNFLVAFARTCEYEADLVVRRDALTGHNTRQVIEHWNRVPEQITSGCRRLSDDCEGLSITAVEIARVLLELVASGNCADKLLVALGRVLDLFHVLQTLVLVTNPSFSGSAEKQKSSLAEGKQDEHGMVGGLGAHMVPVLMPRKLLADRFVGDSPLPEPAVRLHDTGYFPFEDMLDTLVAEATGQMDANTKPRAHYYTGQTAGPHVERARRIERLQETARAWQRAKPERAVLARLAQFNGHVTEGYEFDDAKIAHVAGADEEDFSTFYRLLGELYAPRLGLDGAFVAGYDSEKLDPAHYLAKARSEGAPRYTYGAKLSDILYLSHRGDEAEKIAFHPQPKMSNEVFEKSKRLVNVYHPIPTLKSPTETGERKSVELLKELVEAVNAGSKTAGRFVAVDDIKEMMELEEAGAPGAHTPLTWFIQQETLERNNRYLDAIKRALIPAEQDDDHVIVAAEMQDVSASDHSPQYALRVYLDNEKLMKQYGG